MQTLLLKLGGSVITHKNKDEPELNKDNLSRIATEIAASVKDIKLVIVNGAGSYGHLIADKYNLAADTTDKNLVHLAECQALVNELNSLVCLDLTNKGVAAYPFQISASSTAVDKQLRNINTYLIKKLLDKNIAPVLFGTTMYDEKQGFSIISGDQIIRVLASELSPSKVVFATNVEGIFDKNPQKNKDAELLKTLTLNDLKKIEADSSADVDVTGGMKGKISHILSMRNIKCQVINGNTPGNIQKALSGDESIGTIIQL